MFGPERMLAVPTASGVDLAFALCTGIGPYEEEELVAGEGPLESGLDGNRETEPDATGARSALAAAAKWPTDGPFWLASLWAAAALFIL